MRYADPERDVPPELSAAAGAEDDVRSARAPEVPAGAGDTASPLAALDDVVASLSGGPLSYSALAIVEGLGFARVWRLWPARSLLVVGASPLAAEFRRLIATGTARGWELFSDGRTPLDELAAPLLRLSGSSRFYNLLDREGFGYVEEVAALPDACLLDLRNGGPKLVAAVRRVLAELQHRNPAAGRAAAGARDVGSQAPDPAADALRVVAWWAVAELGARTAGDLAAVTGRVAELPPDVAAAWALLSRLDLLQIAGLGSSGADPATLADEVLAALGERRRLILTSRTFAPTRRTYDSLAAELGVSRERVRQLEADALLKLRRIVAVYQYAPLRWRAYSSRGRVVIAETDAADGAPPWLPRFLHWLTEDLT